MAVKKKEKKKRVELVQSSWMCRVFDREFAYDFHKRGRWCMNNLSDGLVCEGGCHSPTVVIVLNLTDYGELIE